MTIAIVAIHDTGLLSDRRVKQIQALFERDQQETPTKQRLVSVIRNPALTFLVAEDVDDEDDSNTQVVGLAVGLDAQSITRRRRESVEMHFNQKVPHEQRRTAQMELEGRISGRTFAGSR